MTSIKDIDRKLWLDFVCSVKKNNQKISKVIEPMLREYIRKNTEKELI